jgi:RNA polymerase sigma factor (sigma-70 family)
MIDMDESGFETFYRESRDGCFRALIVAVTDPVEAEDLLAEAYARCLESWPKVRTHPIPAAWVVTVAMNLHRDRWRKTRRALKSLLTSDASEPPPLPIDPSLLAAVRALPDQQRRVLALRVILDFDTNATADALGIAPGTVTTHLHRALSALRDELSKEKVS